MGLASFWTSITGPRVREIAPPKNRYGTLDSRPATSSGVVRTVRKTPSLDDDDEGGRELNQVESILTKNIIEPPPADVPTLEEKKAKRRSRGLSLSKSKTDEGVRRRRSLFGGNKDAAKSEPLPEVPTLPTLSAIYSRQAPHHLSDVDRPSTAVSMITTPTSPTSRLPAFTGITKPQPVHRPQANAVGEVFELPAELPSSARPTAVELPARSEIELKKARRKSLGEVLTGKRSKSTGNAALSSTTTAADAPTVPALPGAGAGAATTKPIEEAAKKEDVRSRRNSNASVASKASKISRKSKRKSWWQRAKSRDDEAELLPPMPVSSTAQAKARETPTPDSINLSSFPAVPPKKQAKDDDDAASIRTTRSEKATARTKPQRTKSKKQRPQSSASQIRRKRRSSWWTSSNPDDSDDDSNPLPPVPLLIRSTRTTPDSSPTNSETGRLPSYVAVRGDTVKAPRPVSGISTTSRMYTPRSAAKSFLVSTTPVSDNVRKSIRNSMHAAEDLDSGFENDRGTYCLSAEQQREWEKLKHLMAVMDRRRDATRKTFGEESVADMFPDTPPGVTARGGARDGKDAGDEEREGVKYSNRSALAALEVGVAK